MLQTTMIKLVNKKINKTLGMFGLKLSRTRNDAAHQIVKGLATNRIDVVLDVGANTGQFAKSIRHANYHGKIVCFEPLPDAHEKLKSRFIRDGRTFIHPRTALGDVRGSVQFNVSGNSVSSSILNLLPSHSDAAPESTYIDTIETNIDCLDNIFADYVAPEDRVFSQN